MRKAYWISTAVVVVVVSAGMYWKTSQPSSTAVQYTEDRVTRGNLQATVLSTGTVQPENRLEIKPAFNGRVERILFEEGQPIKKGQVIAWVSSTERAALVDAARAESEDELKNWQRYYPETPIYAPISGILILKNVEAGQSFTTADSVFVLSDRLTVKAQVDETNIAKIRLKQKAQITLDAYPNQPLDATVTHRGYDAKTVNSVTTYIVDVTPNTTPDTMLSGMTANVRFFLDEKSGILLIPSAAIKSRDGVAYVQVPSDNKSKPNEKAIQTGIVEGEQTEILSGVNEGETILIPTVQIPQSTRQMNSPFSPFGGKRPPGGSGRSGGGKK